MEQLLAEPAIGHRTEVPRIVSIAPTSVRARRQIEVATHAADFQPPVTNSRSNSLRSQFAEQLLANRSGRSPGRTTTCLWHGVQQVNRALQLDRSAHDKNYRAHFCHSARGVGWAARSCSVAISLSGACLAPLPAAHGQRSPSGSLWVPLVLQAPSGPSGSLCVVQGPSGSSGSF
jgi:hypothetical protein